MPDILPFLFFICLIPSTFICFFFFPSLCEHGHGSNAKISKNCFIMFYLVGISYFIINRQYSFFLIVLCRRTIECLFFRYKRSRMNILQLILGIVYYFMMSHHLSAYTHFYEPNVENFYQSNPEMPESINSSETLTESMSQSSLSLMSKLYSFFVKNIYQLGRNNFNFKRIFLSKSFIFFNILQSICHYFVFIRRYQNIHYLAEFLMYGHLFLKLRSVTLGLNVIWIVVFGLITMRMRYLERNSEYKNK